MQRTLELTRNMVMNDDLFHPGMSSCQGCGAALSMKIALRALGERTVVVFPACCFTVFVGAYPYTSLGVPIVHCPFATAAITASGVSAALRKRKETDTTVMVWAGDGGTFDIGLQALSGAAERNEDILYVCYDNEAYMNTGIQRSSATPLGAWTTTTPKGSLKPEHKKDIEKIMMAHHIPYLATATAAYPDDMYRKFQKAKSIRGTRFIHLLSSCPPGWRIDPAQSVKAMRMAVQSNVFPLYEVQRSDLVADQSHLTDDWIYTINVFPDKEMPVSDYLKVQGRFRYTTTEMIDMLQERVNRRWETLVNKDEKARSTVFRQPMDQPPDLLKESVPNTNTPAKQ